jgi:hypothetical protein
MTSIRFFGTIVALVAIAGATLSAAQTGWNLKQFAKFARTTPLPMTISILNAKTWNTGFSVTYKPVASACEEYRVQLTVGAKFISLTVTNPQVCDYPTPCSPTDYGQPGCRWAQFAVVGSFSVEWVDKSTTATFTLPTRQNAPENVPMEATTLTIPEALDKTLVTNAMDLIVRIRPIETTTLVSNEPTMYGSIPNDLNDFKVDFIDFSRSNAERSMGVTMRYHLRDWSSVFIGHTYHRRKQPTSPFMFKHRMGSGCTWSDTTTAACRGPGYGYYQRVQPFATPVNDWNYLRMDCSRSYCLDWYMNADTGSSQSYYEYYEDFRLLKHSVTVNWATVKADTQLAVNGYASMATAIDATNTSIANLRFVWHNVSEFRSALTTAAAEAAEARKTVGLYVVSPPYQIQDLWVTVHNQAGTRIFAEMERRVPFRSPAAAGGHVGWMWALNERFDAATTLTIVVRFNRAASLGITEEEKRVALVRGFTEDNNGDLSNVTAPIPKTILSEEGIMGAVAARGILAGQSVATVSFQSCITNNITNKFHDRHFAAKLNTTAAWWAIYDGKSQTTPWHKEHIMMTLMLVVDAVSEDDYSTAYWALADALYPAKPKMLMQFWDPIQVSRLLGFSELPAISATQLASWASERAIIAAAWPWFALEVSETKWQYMRAHVMRSTFAQGGELFLPPFVHLLRHGPVAPNVGLRAEWYTGQIYLTALADIPFEGELYPDFNAASFSKHEYFLRYGEVPAGATDATTVPGWTGYLDLTRPSRDVLVNLWKAQYGETKKQALGRVISVLGVKQASMPVNVDGLGSTAEQVNMATALLASEKATLAWQLADANAEYITLP